MWEKTGHVQLLVSLPSCHRPTEAELEWCCDLSCQDIVARRLNRRAAPGPSDFGSWSTPAGSGPGHGLGGSERNASRSVEDRRVPIHRGRTMNKRVLFPKTNVEERSKNPCEVSNMFNDWVCWYVTHRSTCECAFCLVISRNFGKNSCQHGSCVLLCRLNQKFRVSVKPVGEEFWD